MQTFLPYINYSDCAKVLDTKRCGKQRVESYINNYIFKEINYMIIYKVTNLKNNKIYIGRTKEELEKRKYCHYIKSNNPTSYFHYALNKYNKSDFKWEIIDECLTEKQAIKKETYYIKKYNSTNHNIGYNITNSGKFGGDVMSNHPRKNEIYKNTDRSYVTDEWKQKLSKTAIEKNFGKWMTGKKLSNKTRKKISIKIQEALLDPIKRQKICRKGIKSNRKTKKYKIITPTGNIIITDRLNDFCKKNNIPTGHMMNVAIGKRKQCHNYKCERID